ncbi:hypothetical protein MBLNU459_g4809t1 [Dothideomycetes sp. NU459]
MNSSNGSSASRTSSTTAAASSSLRPRVARLISGLDEGDESSFNPATAPSVRIASPLPSPFESREPSPIPARHLPRTGPRHGARKLHSTSTAGRGSLRGSRQHSPASMTEFFSDSWSALQGAAADFLSSSVSASASATSSPVKAPAARRKPSTSGGQPRNTSAPPAHWGPVGAPPVLPINSVGGGSREEREALVRAQKRRELLAGSGAAAVADSLGHFKRRTSDDFASVSAPPGEAEDRDALVYIHHVSPNDTLAGITIKYNCNAAMLRRANRMWPNDRIQARKIVVLPVDACAVKGRPLVSEEYDLLTGTPDVSHRDDPFPTSAPAEPASTGRSRNESVSTVSDRPSSSTRSCIDTEPQWTHDSWVLLPNSTKPTEIARLSRRTLGFFPPARRKSLTYSDFDSPSNSLDLSRALISEHPATSPLKSDQPQRPRQGRRPSSASNGYFPSYLAGPGGVGTMGKNVMSPGPAQDSLNKLFANRLPNVAPPPNQQNLYLPDIPTYLDHTGFSTPVNSGTQSPATMNIEHVGGAIENWVRKLATKASTALPAAERQSGARASVGVAGRGSSGIGDLIEMADQFEIGGMEDDDAEEEDRGRQASSSTLTNSKAFGSSSSFYTQDSLRERGRSGASAGVGQRHKDD